RIVAEGAVAMQLIELCELREVIGSSWAIWMARHVHFFPWRKRAEDLALNLPILFFKRGNSLRDFMCRCRAARGAKVGNTPFEFDQALLALHDPIHILLTAPGSRVVEQAAQRFFQIVAVD